MREQVERLEARIGENQAASKPVATLQQDVQELREQAVGLEARIGEIQAAPESTLLMDQIMTRMTDLRQRIDEMMKGGTPDPEALAEIQQQMAAVEQQMQQMAAIEQEMQQMMDREQAMPEARC